MVYGAAILDRTNTVDFGFKYKTLTPIPELREFTDTFEQVCDNRAVSLYAEADKRDCKINIMWSGGIDSTVALISLLKTGRTDRLHVGMSGASIEEYPLFYEKFILDKLEHSIVEDPKKLLSIKDINVTGEIGDQIFGSAAIYKADSQGKLFVPYREYISEVFLEKIKDQIAKCPVPIITTFDFLWWFNFSMKYQNVQLRMYPSVLLPYGTLSHFFDTEDFQLWSLNNPDKKIKSDIKSYKFTAKDYIYDFTKDADYRDNKIKVGSLKLGMIPYSIDENFSCVKVMK